MKTLLIAAVLLLQNPAQYSVNGQLSFDDGEPAISANIAAVRVTEPDKPTPYARSFPSTETGAFHIQNLAPGSYRIRVTLAADVVLYYPGVATESAATIITVAADKDPEPVNFVLPAAVSGVKVRGQVHFQAERPPVSLTSTYNNQPRQAAIAEDGTFLFDHVQKGTYLVGIAAPGFRIARLDVGKDDIAGFDLTIPKLIPTEGNADVEGAAGRPAFKLLFDSPLFRTVLDVKPDGGFAAALPASTYRLMVSGLPAGYYLKSLKAGTTDLLASRFKIADGDSPVHIALTLARSSGVAVEGHIDSTGEAPAAGYARKLHLEGEAVDEVAETLVKPDGTFEFPKIMPNAYLARMTLTSSVSSPAVPVAIPNKDLPDLAIVIPGPKEITGRIAVDGFGQPPRFSLLLLHAADVPMDTPKNGTLPSLSLPFSPDGLASVVRNAGSGSQTLQIAVNALPDGSFRVKLPLGDYRLAAAPGNGAVPPAYVLRSIRYGAADLLREPLSISEGESKEIQLEFGTVAPDPWVRLKGRVVGFDPLNGPFRVALEGPVTATVEAPVNPDGSFEFPSILPRNTYTARLLPSTPAASTPRVTVAEKDVSGIEIVVPRLREVAGVVTVDSGAPTPGFTLSLNGASSMTIMVRPDAGGRFRAQLPEDERRVRITGLPLGYSVKSITYGAADLLTQPLKTNDSDELHVLISTDPAARTANVSGRISGLDASRGPYRVGLNGVTAVSQFEAPVDNNGSFSFSDVPQGSYFISMSGALLTPPSIAVAGVDLTELQFAATLQQRNSVDDAPTGATLTDLSGGSSIAANESAAVGSLRTVETAEVTYLSMNKGKYGSLQDMVAAGLLAPRFAAVSNGYMFAIISLGSTFEVAAIPFSTETGRYAFYGTPDGVIRYATFDPFAPPGQGGGPVG